MAATGRAGLGKTLAGAPAGPSGPIGGGTGLAVSAANAVGSDAISSSARPATSVFTISRRRRLGRELYRVGTIAVAERRCIDLLELDLAGQHLRLPGVLLGDPIVEFRHDLACKELEAFANMLVRVFAGLIEQDHLVDVRGLEAAELPPQRLGRADQAAGQGASEILWVGALPLLVFLPEIDRARRWSLARGT